MNPNPAQLQILSPFLIRLFSGNSPTGILRQHLQDKKDKSLLIHKNVIYTKKSNSIYIDDNIYIHGDIVDLDAWVYMIQ